MLWTVVLSVLRTVVLSVLNSTDSYIWTLFYDLYRICYGSKEHKKSTESLAQLGHTKLIKYFSDNSDFIYDTGGRQKKHTKKDESN